MKRRIMICMILLLVAVVGFSTPVEAQRRKLSKTSATVKKGKTITIKMLNNKKKVRWSTNNRKIVKIVKKTNKYVKIKGVKKGNARIIAKVGKKKYTCKITVKKNNGVSKKQLLKAYGSVWTSGMKCCLFYMNNDKIPEMLCFDGKECLIYTYKNGKASKVSGPVTWSVDLMYGGIYFVPKKNLLCVRTSMGEYYSLYKNFKIVKQASAATHLGYTEDGEPHYYIEDKEVSYTKWRTTLKAWGLKKEYIFDEIVDMYDSLEVAYKHIVKE